ncbi:hypothetical protein M513_07528 [Trichuris suis]|uniref:Uncharacterized protein n=1 Tax=Trichuris suis TaxID=68888 RepID=A0A085M353_9BILA|nr:hypothetical protein M513_07528 [Trichuris suis]
MYIYGSQLYDATVERSLPFVIKQLAFPVGVANFKPAYLQCVMVSNQVCTFLMELLGKETVMRIESQFPHGLFAYSRTDILPRRTLRRYEAVVSGAGDSTEMGSIDQQRSII